MRGYTFYRDILPIHCKRSLFCMVLILLACHAPQPALKSQPVVPSPVAEAKIVDKYVFLPITLHHDAVTVILDLGTDTPLYLWPSTLESVGIPWQSVLDSLGIGSKQEVHVPAKKMNMPWAPSPPVGFGPIVGLIGTGVLQHYDLLFDGASHRVLLYERMPPTTRTQQLPPTEIADTHWLPAGLVASDCVPMTVPVNGSIYFTMTVNGQHIPANFDSGAPRTTMNIPAAHLLGLRQSDPNVRLLPPDSSMSYPGAGLGRQKNYAVTHLDVTVGERLLPISTMYVLQFIPAPDQSRPLIEVGNDVFRGRLLWISYGTKRICWSEPLESLHLPP
jgi:hypothetical protein